MFALNLYWRWTSGTPVIVVIPGVVCVADSLLSRVVVSDSIVTDVQLEASSKDCC